MFPKHKGYVEAFGGSGYMLFAKEPSKWEVLNDFDGKLMNFWSVIMTRLFQKELVVEKQKEIEGKGVK